MFIQHSDRDQEDGYVQLTPFFLLVLEGMHESIRSKGKL